MPDRPYEFAQTLIVGSGEAGSALQSTADRTFVVYADEDATVPADVALTADGTALAGGVVRVTDGSMSPLLFSASPRLYIQGNDGVERLYPVADAAQFVLRSESLIGVDVDGVPYFSTGLSFDEAVPLLLDTDGVPYIAEAS